MTSKATLGAAQHHDFVGVVALDLAKITQMAAEEVSRISTLLAATAGEILECDSHQSRRALVAKAMRDYDTAVKWIQVIMPPDNNEIRAAAEAQGRSSCGGVARSCPPGQGQELLVPDFGG